MPFVPLDQVATESRRPRTGFIPLSDVSTDEPASERRGFIPVDDVEQEQPSVLKTVLLENPGTAALEAGANLASQVVSLPAAGLAGLGTLAGNVLGLTDREPADVVQAVGGALTYQPRGKMGQGAAEIVAYPFQKLAEAGGYAGGKVLDATGSPLLATVVDTAIQAAPMAIAPGIKGARAVREKFRTATEEAKATPGEAAKATAAEPATEQRGFIPLE